MHNLIRSCCQLASPNYWFQSSLYVPHLQHGRRSSDACVQKQLVMSASPLPAAVAWDYQSTYIQLYGADVSCLPCCCPAVLFCVKHLDPAKYHGLTGLHQPGALAFAKELRDRNIPFWLRCVLHWACCLAWHCDYHYGTFAHQCWSVVHDCPLTETADASI